MTKQKFKKLEKKYNAAIDAFAQDIAMQIEATYEEAINNFYESYEPRWYNRTYSTYLASSGYTGLFDNWKHDDDYYAGIEVDSGNIPGKPYRADTEWVFNRTFVKGIHGYGLMDRRKYGFNKSDYMNAYRKKKEYKKWNKIWTGQKKINQVVNGRMIHGLQIGFNNALNDYKPLIAATGRYVLNSGKPKKQVDRQFKKLTRKKNMDVMASKYIDAIFK